MLTRRVDTSARFTRHDIPRVAIAAGILILALAAILGADILPEAPLDVAQGQIATRDIVAPRAVDFESTVQTDAARAAASAAVPFQYSFTTENAIAIAAAQQLKFEERVKPIDTTFSASLSPEPRKTLLAADLPDLSDTREGDARRARSGGLGGGPHRSRAGPRRDAADGAARHGRGGHEDPPGRADGRSARRGRADARRRDHRSARRPQLIARPRAHHAGARDGGRGGRPGPGHDPPGRGHRPQRLAAGRDRHREDRRARAAPVGARRRELRRLAAAGRARRVDAAGVAVALPPGALASRQRPHPDRAAGRRRDPRAQGDGRAPDAAVLPADRGDRDAAGDPARCVGRDLRHRPRGDHRRRGQRRLARVRDLHLPRRHGRHRRRPPGRPAPDVRPGVRRGVRGRGAGRPRLLAPRRARHPGHLRAVVRLGGLGRGVGGRGGRLVRGARRRCSGS